MKARRIRSGSRKPVVSATRSIASLEDCTRCRATSTRSRSTAFDGVVPVSAMKARAKCRELIPARSARASTVSGASRCSRAQASSGTEAAGRRFQFQQRGELRLAAAAAVIEHELARGLLRDFVAEIFRHHRQRKIDAGADARPNVQILPSRVKMRSGSSFTLRIGAEEMPGARPMRGGAAAVEQAGFGQDVGARADAGDAHAALGHRAHERQASCRISPRPSPPRRPPRSAS